MVSIVCFCLALTSCGKSPDTTKPAAAQTPAKPVATSTASNAQLDADITQSLSPSVSSAGSLPSVSSRDAALESQADDILAKHRNMLAKDLLNLPEVNESLRNGIKKLAEDKSLQQRITSSVELAAKLKGLEGTPGSVGLDLDTKGYDRAQKSRMLQTVLSEDPKRIVNFIVGEIGEATPELTFGGADRAANGVAIKENTSPAK